MRKSNLLPDLLRTGLAGPDNSHIRRKLVAIVLANHKNEPPHDKTNNVVLRPAKTQISLGIRPVWSESSLSAWRKLVLSYPLSAQRRLWSDWADAQADLSLRWAHTHFVGFVTTRLINGKFTDILKCILWDFDKNVDTFFFFAKYICT